MMARLARLWRGYGFMIGSYMALLWAFGWGGALPAAAQNNPYKIKDALYPIYQRATMFRASEKGLLVADTLFAEAAKLRDKKAQCLALVIPTFYYAAKSDYTNLQRVCDRLRTFSRKNGFLQYFYFAYSQEIVLLLNQKRSLHALQVTEAMKNAAFDDNDPFGIFTSFRTAGHIYTVRMNYQMALEQYQMALEYALESLHEQSLSPVYLNIAKAYSNLKNFPKALEYVEQAMKTARSDENKVTSRQIMCSVLYDMKEKEKFNACYEQCMEDVRKYGVIRGNDLKVLRIKKAMINGEYEEAAQLANDSSLETILRLDLQRSICEKLGDYKTALDIYSRRRRMMDSIYNETQAIDMNELIVQIGAERLKLKTQSLELDNAKLKLEQVTTRSSYERAEAEKKELALKNQQLELARVKTEAEKKTLLLKENEAKSRYQILSFTLVVSLLSLIIGFLVFYLRRRHILLMRMAEKNEELKLARDQAEQADRMKTVFIQNMSHEIRTPLNAIVGFSQLLTTPDMQLEEEQKMEFSQLIEHNSELLTTLVNDVLDLANLESGKYTMKIEPCSCNMLCDTSVATVIHRKAEAVNLYFTSEVADDYMIQTDAKRVEQVLINFLVNAEKYTERGEIHLHCSVSENPGCVTLSVTDTGPGVPPDKADLIFERFQKLDEFKQGTGLGLHICRLIAERLDGEVKLDKSYTGGARFLLILPLREE